MKVLLTGDLRKDNVIPSGTRRYVQCFVDAIKEARNKEDLTFLLAGSYGATRIRRLIDLVRLGKCVDIIHCLTAGRDVELSFFLTRKYHAKLVLSVHGHVAQEQAGFEFPWRHKVRYVTYNVIMRRADALIFPSKVFSVLVRGSIPSLEEDRCYIVPNGITESWLASGPRKRPVGKAIGIVGKWNKIKGIERLPLITEAVATMGLEVVWIGAQKQPMFEAQNFKTIPPVSQGMLKQILDDEIIIVLVPSLTESFSLAALEAMGRGIPVITSELVGISEVIKQYEAGVLVDWKSTQEIFSAIQCILDSYEKYSRNAWAAAKAHTWSEVLMRYIEIYQAVGRR